MSKISVRVSDEEVSNEPSGRLSDTRLPPGVREIDCALLGEKVKELSTQLSEVFSDLKTVGNLKLNKIELGIEINGEAGINLIASGKVGGKGVIKLVFEPA